MRISNINLTLDRYSTPNIGASLPSCTGPAGTGHIIGFIFDEFFNAVDGALIYACRSTFCYRTTSAADGSFNISGVSDGTYTVRYGKDLGGGALGFLSVPLVSIIGGSTNDLGIRVFDSVYQDPKCP